MNADWLPLESNPEVMNKLLQQFGVPKQWQITDVYGLDSDMLAFVPQPTAAVIMLFPLTQKLEESGAGDQSTDAAKDLVFIKQYIHNACGTIALIHAVANNEDKIILEDGPLKTFIEKAKSLDPEAAGKLLQESAEISSIHQEIAEHGQTEPTRISEHHYVAFVNKNGDLYELDGRKASPIKHSVTSDGTFLQDAANVIKNYISLDPENIQFSVVALSTV